MAKNLPGSTAGARFPQLCLRKLYVVCGRGGGSASLDGCLQEVRAHSRDDKIGVGRDAFESLSSSVQWSAVNARSIAAPAPVYLGGRDLEKAIDA